MGNSFEVIEALAQRARHEEPAVGDVRNAVLGRLREGAVPRFSDAPLLVFAAVYATAAVVMIGVAVHLSAPATDPLAPLFALAQTFTL